MKFFVYLISLSTLLLSNNAGALSLNEAIDESLANNLLLKMEAHSVDIAEEDYFQSKTSYLPSININANIAETEYSNLRAQSGISSNDYELSPSSKSIVLSQNLFSGFSRIYNSISSKESLSLKRLNEKKVTQDIILETIEAYYNVLIAEKTVQSYRDNLESVTERSNATIKEYEVGLASKTDVAQAEAYLNNAKIDLLDSKIILKNLKNLFIDLVGVDAENLIFSEINADIPNSFNQFKEILIANNYSIRMAEANLNIMDANVGVAQSAYYPQLNLTATKSELDEYSSTVDELTSEEIKASLNWPIFTAGKSLSNVRKAKEMKNSQYILLQKTRNETVILSENIWDKFQISEQTIKAAELTYNANQTAYKGTVIEQEVGERSVLDVLKARQSLLNSEINYFNKQKDREIIKTQIMYMSGTLDLKNLKVN
ncbi:TolC family protein [Pelagibacteraceae bacterium]|nr:TolC family protein [Pelagibacteraceae bacterium]